jgi:hypothetical protein
MTLGKHAVILLLEYGFVSALYCWRKAELRVNFFLRTALSLECGSLFLVSCAECDKRKKSPLFDIKQMLSSWLLMAD